MDHQDLQPCEEPDRPPQVWVHEQTPSGADGIRARVERVVELANTSTVNAIERARGSPPPPSMNPPGSSASSVSRVTAAMAATTRTMPVHIVRSMTGAERCLGGRRMSRESSGSTPSASAGAGLSGQSPDASDLG